MVSFTASLKHVKEHLDQCLPAFLILNICRQVGHVWRKCPLTPDVTIHLLLMQILARVGLRGLRHAGGTPTSFQAIGKARQRLPGQVFAALLEHSLPKDFSMGSFYKGFKTYLADGMSFLVEDAAKLAKKYGKASNQKGTSKGYPTPKLLTLLEAGSAFIAKAIILPYAKQECTCLWRLFKKMAPRSLLMGDRALVSFALLAMLMGQGHHGCFRLSRDKVVRGRGKGHRKLIKRLGRQDLLVRWTATRPRWLNSRRWKQMKDQSLELRQIAFRITRKGYRTHWAWIITTLTDPAAYPAAELIELYSQRWQIEVHFRDLKCTLEMKKISARTVAGVQKEVMAFVLLYNLIRQVMAQAAQNQGTSPDRISFTDAALWLLWAPPGSPLAALAVNPKRERNSHPRAIKKGRHRFAQLKQSRAAACKPPCIVKL